jgi:phenylalanyl-tRNA synthetase alpha chain
MNYHEQFEKCTSVSECLQLKDELMNSGEANDIKSQLKSSPSDQKKELGKRLNVIRTAITEVADSRIQKIQEENEKDHYLEYDPTFYSSKYKTKPGALHPITLITEESVTIFRRMGFDVWDGPHVQTQDNNFTLVNTPAHHPARDMQDTFFIEAKDSKGDQFVMRTQVTANIIPYAKAHKPPFRVIFPGIVYRNENIDATHDIHFTQFDMWMVEKKTSVSQLIQLIKTFFREFYDDDSIDVRLRPSYFPFTQPSFEGDISCPFCGGEGCRICKQTGWIEVFGAGPVYENVITNMGLDPQEWEGLAFGFGVDRLAQLKLKISGVSQFYNGHLDFLRGEE